MFFITFKVWITTNEKWCEYENYFGEKSKNQGKLIQFVTPGQHTKNRDCPGKAGTVEMFVTILSFCMFFKLLAENVILND